MGWTDKYSQIGVADSDSPNLGVKEGDIVGVRREDGRPEKVK